ncbi:glutaredoxin family protein [Nocardia flavorosea]|uniref:Glutaredoxin family protein n=1 Tax=Nocardia flavorosea TaxID=53429 RepID=A0A846YS41_9NOCA|nr:glutaredoxin family protein [Nocardia flavorosea]NKY60370.1 glutaredoxin family protein [Nocardia flavorosea]
MLEITVYSRPDCQPCKAVARKLDQLGATYRKIDVTEDPAAGEYLRSLGYASTPVTVVGEHHKHGYAPEWLKWAASQVA